jgi:hypothetical protein
LKKSENNEMPGPGGGFERPTAPDLEVLNEDEPDFEVVDAPLEAQDFFDQVRDRMADELLEEIKADEELEDVTREEAIEVVDGKLLDKLKATKGDMRQEVLETVAPWKNYLSKIEDREVPDPGQLFPEDVDRISEQLLTPRTIKDKKTGKPREIDNMKALVNRTRIEKRENPLWAQRRAEKLREETDA